MTGRVITKSDKLLPEIGFGTWKLAEGKEVEDAVSAALEAGYRLIDTAKIYGNETGVGKAVNASAVARKDIFLTTKLWNSDHGFEAAKKALAESLQRLEQAYVDLYLIHWPGKDNVGSWKALIELKKQGKTKNIGVSNFSPADIEEIIAATGEAPVVNQIEFNPMIYQKHKQTLEFCKANHIIVEAYSPLSHGKNLDNQILEKIAKEYGKTPAQISLRWALQHGTVPIPKSANPTHIRQNLDIFDFKLSPEQMQAINNSGAGKSALPF